MNTPLSDFQEGQWWVVELDKAAAGNAPFDLKRAVAVVHHLLRSAAAPIDMVLHCPACGLQHIDAPQGLHTPGCAISCGMPARGCSCGKWENPPHRSHLCRRCGYVWRPADVPTNGVAAVKTRGKNDTPLTLGE